MADQASASSTKPAAANGSDKNLWQQTEEGRAHLSAAQKKSRAEHFRDTKAIPPEKIKRLKDLVKGGATVKDAAKLVRMGYSTAQRKLREPDKKASGVAPKATKSAKATKRKARARLTPEQIKVLKRLVPKMPQMRAEDIAARAHCHVSSVYTYRSKMVSAETLDEAEVSAPDAERGMPLVFYKEMEKSLERMWEDCYDKRRELTNGELRAVMTWRRLHPEMG